MQIGPGKILAGVAPAGFVEGFGKEYQHLRYEYLCQFIAKAKQSQPDKETVRVLEKTIRGQQYTTDRSPEEVEACTGEENSNG